MCSAGIFKKSIAVFAVMAMVFTSLGLNTATVKAAGDANQYKVDNTVTSYTKPEAIRKLQL